MLAICARAKLLLLLLYHHYAKSMDNLFLSRTQEMRALMWWL